MASEIFTNGATEENRTKHTMLEKTLGKDFRVEFFHPVISKAVKGLHMQNIQQFIQNKKRGFVIFCPIVCGAGARHKSHKISTNHENAHSTKNMIDLPTMVMLTVALFPVPTVLIGTQVYTPSASTVMFNRPELWLPIMASLK